MARAPWTNPGDLAPTVDPDRALGAPARAFREHIFPDEDAGTTPTWTMTFRMVSDPDPARWKVALFAFSKQ